ncbi:MAG: arginine--tRNA ligase, partial [Calditrichaeota bacterium]
MTTPNFKDIFANQAAKAFQTSFPEKYSEIGDSEVFSAEFILDNIEKPKDPTKGRFAFPVFKYGKLLGENPPSIAGKIVNSIAKNSEISVSAIGGFINVQTAFDIESKATLSSIITNDSHYADSTIGKDKKILVEYSAPNIAKPFGIGHIRTTILGNSLRLIFKKLGYETVGINYLGDWGTQFGKMITAYKKWADPTIKGNETIAELLELYVKFHDVAGENPELEAEAREEFKMLENGDRENIKLWEKFRKISIDEFNRVYNIMGVEFDWVTGEAFMNDKMEPAIERLEKAGLVSESEGATIVDLHDEQLPPVLLKKADGATLYLTRDIAGFLFRWETYKFDEMIYVVATNQSVHFQQLFKAIEMLEEKENTESIAERAKHIDFGLIKFGDKMMSTRKGHIIFLEDVINKAAELAKEKISEKNPSLENIDKTALQIGLGAIFYSQMSVRRQKE